MCSKLDNSFKSCRNLPSAITYTRKKSRPNNKSGLNWQGIFLRNKMLQHNLYFIYLKQKTKQNTTFTFKPKRSGFRNPHQCSAQLHPCSLLLCCHTLPHRACPTLTLRCLTCSIERGQACAGMAPWGCPDDSVIGGRFRDKFPWPQRTCMY